MPAGDDSRDPGCPPSTGWTPYANWKRSSGGGSMNGGGGGGSDQPGSTTPDRFKSVRKAAQVGNNISFSIRTLSYDQAGNPNTKTLDWIGTPQEFNEIEWGKFADYVGLDAGVFENLIYNKYFWLGKDLKFRSTRISGNGATGGKYKYARNTSRFFKGLGVGLFIINSILTYNEAKKYYDEGGDKPGVKIKAGLDIGMGFIGTFGGIKGFGIALTYFILNEYGAFDWILEIEALKQSKFKGIDRIRCHPSW